MPPRNDQLGLFTPPDTPITSVDPLPASAELADLARQLPRNLYLGTSSWSFPGWADLVYASKTTETRLAREGLPAYAACPLHRTVGLDRAFYKPLPETEYRELAAQVPTGFRFLVKAWQSITRPDADERGRTQGSTKDLAERGKPNAYFLDSGPAIDLVVAPAIRGLGGAAEGKLGPIVFQFPPLDLKRSGPFGGPTGFLERLAAFAGAIHDRVKRAALIAYEVRNRELFEPRNAERLAELLASARACHGFAHHPSIPTIDAQRAALETAGYPLEAQPAFVCRWLLRHDQTYDGAKSRYEPFNRLLDADLDARSQIASAIHAALSRSTPGDAAAWVIANNKAEGSAPITLRRLAASLVTP